MVHCIQLRGMPSRSRPMQTSHLSIKRSLFYLRSDIQVRVHANIYFFQSWSSKFNYTAEVMTKATLNELIKLLKKPTFDAAKVGKCQSFTIVHNRNHSEPASCI